MVAAGACAIAPGARTPAGIFCHQPIKECFMKWETPKAVDLRFGFEITMYVFNR
ncbi:MAG: Coenzyme PQQ synthesis protein A [Paracidovorax wautersii]|uniref:Coenzyme PQQ synthesis protein A n=1 Tax=Paracidovorax wautersii TaxID=1177982 RepID=A0A7V8JRE2_9BURK|nr:MAG: Coenzyme PQQ synthesis protein A [Paracidovorax wautersii]